MKFIVGPTQVTKIETDWILHNSFNLYLFKNSIIDFKYITALISCLILFHYNSRSLRISSDFFQVLSFLYTEMLLVAEASSFYVIENCFEHPIMSLVLNSGKCVLQLLQPIPWLYSEKQKIKH